MVKTIPHRELRNRSSEVLRRAQAGETLQITSHGEVVAVLVPPDDDLTLRVIPASIRGGETAGRGDRIGAIGTLPGDGVGA